MSKIHGDNVKLEIDINNVIKKINVKQASNIYPSSMTQ